MKCGLCGLHGKAHRGKGRRRQLPHKHQAFEVGRRGKVVPRPNKKREGLTKPL